MTDPTPTPTPDPGRPPKPAMSDARISGMVAAAVLVGLAIFVAWFVWLSA